MGACWCNKWFCKRNASLHRQKDGGQPENGLWHRVVCNLVSNLKGKNYHILWDNFFTLVRLADDLLSDKLYLCGRKTDSPQWSTFTSGLLAFKSVGKSVLLAHVLLCGTTCANRTDFPKDLKANKPKVKALHCGESVFRQKGNIVASVW